jgi:cell division septation protein DedD
MKLNTILVFSALVLASGLVWYSVTNKDEGVPIIRADNSAIKVHPDDRGGMEIENQDSTIYQALRKDGSSARVENLLANNTQNRDNAAPINRDELFAGLKTHQENNAAAQIQNDLTQNETLAAPTHAPIDVQAEKPVIVAPSHKEEDQTKSAPSLATASASINVNDNNNGSGNVTNNDSAISAPIARPKTISSATQTNTKQPEKALTSLLAEVQGLKTAPLHTQKSTTKPTAPSAQAGHSYIQIGSLTSARAATAHWETRQQQFPALLKGYKLRIQDVEIAGRGTYYRVQAGPVSKESAQQACLEINKRFAKSCIVK